MCIIIVKSKDKKVSQSVLRASSLINPHGLGVIWLDTNEVNYHKSKEWSVLDTDRPYIAHFRYATKGKINRENTHPFECGNNSNELLMHNGTLLGYGSKDLCDSKQLANELGHRPRHQWREILGQHDSRFVSYNKRNRQYQIYNKNLWTQKDGVWFSKTNVLQDNLVAVYGTLKKGYSNNSMLSGSRYVGKGTTLDKYPLEVSGLPYLHDVKGSGYNVDVHIYKVSDNVLKNLDSLEGHPYHYKRSEIMIKRKKGQIKCWVYFIQTRPYSNFMNCIQSYKQERPSTNYRGSSYPYNFFRNEDYKPSYTKRITDFYSSVETDQEERYCSTCMVEVKTDDHEISDSKYYCEICCNHFTESEVMK